MSDRIELRPHVDPGYNVVCINPLLHNTCTPGQSYNHHQHMASITNVRIEMRIAAAIDVSMYLLFIPIPAGLGRLWPPGLFGHDDLVNTQDG